MEKAAAVFDVDGTLVRGGTERLFFLYLLRRRKLNPTRALAFLGRLAAQPRRRFLDKGYLAGLDVEEVAHLGRCCHREVIVPRLRPRGLACLKAHQAQARQIVLLTGSLAFLMVPLKEELGADWLIATELERREGLLTGAILDPHPRGVNKRLLLEELARALDLNLTRSYAYGDQLEDGPLLEGVGRPVAVNPSRALRRLARERGWPIDYF